MRSDLSSGRLKKVEALLRWDHPQRGSVGPQVFIPLAAGSGVQVQEVNRLLAQFEQMQKMMKMLSQGGGLSKMMRNMRHLIPGR